MELDVLRPPAPPQRLLWEQLLGSTTCTVYFPIEMHFLQSGILVCETKIVLIWALRKLYLLVEEELTHAVVQPIGGKKINRQVILYRAPFGASVCDHVFFRTIEFGLGMAIIDICGIIEKERGMQRCKFMPQLWQEM